MTFGFMDISLDVKKAYSVCVKSEVVKDMLEKGLVFSSAFVLLEPYNISIDKWQMNYLNNDTNELSSFDVSFQGVEFKSTSPRVHVNKKAMELDMKTVSVGAKKTLGIAEKELLKIFKATKMLKLFLTLNCDDEYDRAVWTVTYTAPAFQYVKIVIDAESGKVLLSERKSFLV